MPGNLHFVELAVGRSHGCGRTSDGTAYCWNANPFMNFGRTDATQLPAPERIDGGSSFSSIRASESGTEACGMTTGGAYGWGNNDYGQLGVNADTDQATPVAVDGQSP